MKPAIILFVLSFVFSIIGALLSDLTDLNTLSFILISFGVISLLGGMLFIIGTTIGGTTK